MSKVIPGNTHTSQAWHKPELDDSRARVAKEEPTLDPAEIEAIKLQAYQEAYAQGLEKGRQEGLKAGQDSIDQVVAVFNSLIASLAEPLKEQDVQVEQSLVELALAVAQQVVRREIKLDSGQVVAVVREALGMISPETNRVRIHVHPDEQGLVKKALSMDENVARIDVVEDPSVSRGGCRLETESSQVDATVESRLAEIAATLLGGERESD